MNDLTQEEGHQVGWLLTEIENQTQGQLPDGARQNLITEVASHLDAAIRARVESGMSPLEAESDAVKAFGPPNDYISDLVNVHNCPATGRQGIFRGDRRVMISFWVLTLSLITCLLSGIRDHTMRDPLALAVVFGSVFAYFSFRSLRIQLIPLAGASVLATVLFMVAATLFWTNLNVYGGGGVIPNWEIASMREEEQKQVQILKPIVATLKAGVSLHSRYLTESKLATLSPEQNSLALSIPEGVGLPTFDHWQASMGARLNLKRAKSIAEANEAWDSVGHRLLYDLEPRLDHTQQFLTVTNHLGPKRYVSEFAFNIWQNMIAFPAWLGFTFAINFIFGGLGILTSRVTIRRRPRTA